MRLAYDVDRIPLVGVVSNDDSRGLGTRIPVALEPHVQR